MADWWDSTKDRMAILDKAAGDKGMGAIGMVSPLGKVAQFAKAAGPALRRLGTKQPAYSLPKSLDRINNQRFMTPELQQQMVFGAGRVPGAFSQAAGAAKTALKASPLAALGAGIGYNASDMGSANAVPAAGERLTVPSHTPNAPIDYRAAGMPYKGGNTAVGADDWRGYRDGRYVENGPRIIRKNGKITLTNVDNPNAALPGFRSGEQGIRAENGQGFSVYTGAGGMDNNALRALSGRQIATQGQPVSSAEDDVSIANILSGVRDPNLAGIRMAGLLATDDFNRTARLEGREREGQKLELEAAKEMRAQEELGLRRDELMSGLPYKDAMTKYYGALSGGILPASQKVEQEKQALEYQTYAKLLGEIMQMPEGEDKDQALRDLQAFYQGNIRTVTQEEKEGNLFGFGKKEKQYDYVPVRPALPKQ